MNFSIVDFICSKGDGNVIEDIGDIHSNFLWILDGATQLSKENILSKDSDAAWLVKKMNDRIKHAVNTNGVSKLNLKSILKSASAELLNSLGTDFNVNDLDYTQEPSYAIAIVKIKNGMLEYLILGDCVVLIKSENKIIRLKDDGFITSPKSIYKQPRSIAKKLLLERRAKMNTGSGYWIGSLKGVGFNYATCGAIKVNVDDEIIISTDGLFRLVDLFNLMNVEDIYKTPFKDSLQILRSVESVSPLENRFKRSDDVLAYKCIIQRK